MVRRAMSTSKKGSEAIVMIEWLIGCSVIDLFEIFKSIVAVVLLILQAGGISRGI